MAVTSTVTRTPWAAWRAHAHVTLGWPPEVFWAATPHDLLAALDACQKASETARSANHTHGLTQPTLAQLAALRTAYEMEIT